jgi:hypothetical protein
MLFGKILYSNSLPEVSQIFNTRSTTVLAIVLFFLDELSFIFISLLKKSAPIFLKIYLIKNLPKVSI